jgi:hypothetical protein
MIGGTAGETILGKTLGSGVATGTSSALGNSTTGHIISTVAGGIAGRASGRRMAKRLRNRDIGGQESQPLLSSGDRLGGRRYINRLVDNENQLPQEQPPPNILNRAARTLRNTAQNLSNTVSNVRQQITGRAINSGRGRYSRVSTSEAHEPIEQSCSRSHE